MVQPKARARICFSSLRALMASFALEAVLTESAFHSSLQKHSSRFFDA